MGLARLIFIFILAMVAMAIVRALVRPISSRPQARKSPPQRPARGGKLFKDPVCGTYVAAEGSLTSTRDGETVYFCSEDCRDKFLTA